MRGQKETTPQGGAAPSSVDGQTDTTNSNRSLSELLTTFRFRFEPDRNGRKYQYRIRWRRVGQTRDKARRYDRWCYLFWWVKKLTTDPTWGGKVRPLIYIAIDRREIVAGWELVDEWDEWQL